MENNEFIRDEFIKIVQEKARKRKALERKRKALEERQRYLEEKRAQEQLAIERAAQKKQERKNIFKKFAAGVSLVAVMTAGVVGLYKYNTVDPNNIKYRQIYDDMEVHAGRAFIEGKKISPYQKHDCVAENDGKTPYTERLESKMQGQYTREVIAETVDLFEPLAYGTPEEVEAADERLRAIRDSIYKNEDGLYDSDIVSNNYGLSGFSK